MKSLRWSLAAALSLTLAAACGSDDPPAVGDGNSSGEGNASGDDASLPGGGSGGDSGKKPDAGSPGQGNGGSGAGGDAAARADTSVKQPDPGEEDCAEHIVQTSRVIPDMLVVLDRSLSMTPEYNPTKTDRWKGSVSAVVDVTRSYDDRVHFGLMTFPGTARRGEEASCAPGTLNVPIGVDKGDAIATSLMMMRPTGYTPTAATLQETARIIGSVEVTDGIVPPKYVLLVTDGDPNCSNGTMGPTTDDPVARQATIDAVKALTGAGVQTFVVGYQTGTSNFAGVLDQMASAGGTGQTKHRSVESGADLTMVFEELAARAVSCSYKLDAPVSDPTFVKVSVNGKPRAYQNAMDGWTLGPDKQTVSLTGAACDAVKAGGAFGVQVVCDPVFVQ